MYCRTQLIKHAKEVPDLFNKDEVKEHIKEEEITLEQYTDGAVESINDAIDSLTESVQEKISDYIDRWVDSGDFYNYDIPTGMDSIGFAVLVKMKVREKF